MKAAKRRARMRARAGAARGWRSLTRPWACRGSRTRGARGVRRARADDTVRARRDLRRRLSRATPVTVPRDPPPAAGPPPPPWWRPPRPPEGPQPQPPPPPLILLFDDPLRPRRRRGRVDRLLVSGYPPPRRPHRPSRLLDRGRRRARVGGRRRAAPARRVVACGQCGAWDFGREGVVRARCRARESAASPRWPLPPPRPPARAAPPRALARIQCALGGEDAP